MHDIDTVAFYPGEFCGCRRAACLSWKPPPGDWYLQSFMHSCCPPIWNQFPHPLPLPGGWKWWSPNGIWYHSGRGDCVHCIGLKCTCSAVVYFWYCHWLHHWNHWRKHVYAVIHPPSPCRKIHMDLLSFPWLRQRTGSHWWEALLKLFVLIWILWISFETELNFLYSIYVWRTSTWMLSVTPTKFKRFFQLLLYHPRTGPLICNRRTVHMINWSVHPLIPGGWNCCPQWCLHHPSRGVVQFHDIVFTWLALFIFIRCSPFEFAK